MFLLHRIDVAMAFHILADAAKTNLDILETIQLLAQGKDRFLSAKYIFCLLI